MRFLCGGGLISRVLFHYEKYVCEGGSIFLVHHKKTMSTLTGNRERSFLVVPYLQAGFSWWQVDGMLVRVSPNRYVTGNRARTRLPILQVNLKIVSFSIIFADFFKSCRTTFLIINRKGMSVGKENINECPVWFGSVRHRSNFFFASCSHSGWTETKK